MQDIIIIGGGAAGLAAAITAKELLPSAGVTVLERMQKPGKKLLATGNGRCNLSHTPVSAENYRGSFDVCGLLEKYPTVLPFFDKLGVLTYADGEGRIYPYSNSAATVNDALCGRTRRLGVGLVTGFSVSGLEKRNGAYLVKSADGAFYEAKCVILTSGGCASPAQGSDGSGFSLASALGMRINEPRPALCPLLSEKKLLKPLAGLRVKCAAELIRGGKALRKERGEVQFAADYISGICVFNLSPLAKNGDVVRLDLTPDFEEKQIEELLFAARKRLGKSPAGELCGGIFSGKLARYITERALGKTAETPAEKLSDGDIKRVYSVIKALDFPATGFPGFDSAQVTRGGVAGGEITPAFESKKNRNLFLAGEIIDVNGDCGGFNLHFAWTSGIEAARSAVGALRSL